MHRGSQEFVLKGAAVSLPSKVLGRKLKKLGAIFVKCIFGHLGGGYCPLYLSLATLMLSWEYH